MGYGATDVNQNGRQDGSHLGLTKNSDLRKKSGNFIYFLLATVSANGSVLYAFLTEKR